MRSGKNSHRFIYFVNGKIRSFSTHIDDINSQVAELFGSLNRGLTVALLGAGLLMALSAQNAFALDPLALPTGYQSVAGNPQFAQTANHLTVTSSANRSIVSYQTFNVGSNAGVTFTLPSPNAVILNTVTGGNLSEIYGSIDSNGKVLLVNPAGIFFGNGANINTSGFVASTLDITNQKFLNGQYEFSRILGSNQAGIKVENGVNINIGNGGTASFLGSSFLNNGNISALGGAIQVGVGDRVTLGNDLVGLTVNDSLSDVLNQVAIVNNGNLNADQVKLVASVLQANIHSTIVNNTGHIIANKVVDGTGGTIELIADKGIIINSGTLDASGISGGQVTLQGSGINLAGNTIAPTGAITATATNGNILQTAGSLNANTMTFNATGGNIQQTGGTLATQDFKATTTSAEKSISLIDTDVSQANLHSNNGNILLQDRDGLGVNVQAGSGIATIKADVGSLLLHSNNGVAASGINLSGVNNAQTLNLLTYHGGISQDVGSTISGTTLHAESQDPAHLGIALKDADFTTATFKTNNGLISYKDADGVTVSADAGTGNVDIATFAAGLLSSNGKNDGGLTLTGVNKANTFLATALSGDIVHNSGSITANTANLINKNGNILQDGNSSIQAQTLNMQASHGDVLYKGGFSDAVAVNMAAYKGNVSFTGGTLHAGTANLSAGLGNVSQNGGSINAVTANFYSQDGNVVQNGGNIDANTANLVSSNGNVVLGMGAISANAANFVAHSGSVIKNAGVVHVGTANYVANTGDVVYNGGNTIADTVNVTAQTGNIYYKGGNISAGTANLYAEKGNVDFRDGSINATTASLQSKNGNVITNGGVLSASTVNLRSTNGDVRLNNGIIHAGLANLSANGGNVVKNAGTISGTTVNYVTKNGNLLYLGGRTTGDTVNLTAYNGNLTFTGGTIGAGTASLYTEHGNIVYNGSTNAVTVNLWSKDGSLFSNGGNINATTANLLSTNGNVTLNNGAIQANAANVVATNGSIIKNAGLVNATTANYVAKNGSVLHNGGVTLGSTVNLTAQNGYVGYYGGILNAGKAHLYADHGNILQNAGTLTAGSMSLIADQGNVTQNAGGLIANDLSIRSLNGDITLNGFSNATHAITLTTVNDALNQAGGTINLASGALLQSLAGSVSLNTNHLLLDGSVQGKLVQISTFDPSRSILFGGGVDPNALSLTQTMLGHINTDPALGQNTLMIGSKDYVGTVTLGSVDLSGMPSTSLLIDAPKVLDSTPTSDPAGSFNIRMADNQSVYLTAGATGLGSWNTAVGGTNYGDNNNLFADLDIRIGGTGTINVNLLGSGPMTANSFSLVNGSANKAFINVAPPAAGITFFDDGFTNFKNFSHTLNSVSASSIQNSIKGNTINLLSSPGQSLPSNFGLYLSSPSLGITSL